jgi:hypothetical protein
MPRGFLIELQAEVRSQLMSNRKITSNIGSDCTIADTVL